VEETVATEERFCFVLVDYIIILASLSSINHENRSKSEANSFLPDAYSMLHMHQQSFNPLLHELF